MSDITTDGQRLVKEWEGAKQRVETLRRDLNGAECDASNAETALVRWLLPKDAKPGEKISVWHGDQLIQAEVLPGHSSSSPMARLTIRGRS